MVDGFLLPALALVTMALVIGFALWSKTRTDREHDDPRHRPSTLARTEPDPKFQPDRDVTDPHGVTRG